MNNPQIVSGGISALATLFAGGFAIFLYIKSKSDLKRQAAKALYSEMLQFEQVVRDIKAEKLRSDTVPLYIDPNRYILAKSRWNNDKYLFIDNFDNDQWSKLELFFNQMELLKDSLDTIRELQNQNIESRMDAVHNRLSELALDFEKNKTKTKVTNRGPLSKKYEDLCREFTNSFINNQPFNFSYQPRGAYDFINSGIEQVDTNISTSIIGENLKALTLGFNNRVLLFKRIKTWF